MNKNTMIKLVIFDMDGLMIDSEPLHQKAFDLVFQKYQKNLTEEDNNKYYVGIADKDAAEDMVTRFNLPISATELVRQKQLAYKTIAASQVSPQEGLFALLKNLQRAGYKKVIASSSMLEEIKLIIRGLKIEEYIDGYFSAEQVPHGKPAPDLFLFAAKEMEINPENCLVLEDAPSGIQAAVAAGMQSFAIPSRETKGEDFTGATKILDSLGSVFENVQKL